MANYASTVGPGIIARPVRKPRILLAACGSIAAMKFANLCQCFCEWAEVVAVATEASLRFIDRNAMPPGIKLFTDREEVAHWRRLGDIVLHSELQKWADIMVIAPASANTLAKISGGLCDNLLTCIVRAWDFSRPLFVAPSMYPSMWENPSTERHMLAIEELGITVILPQQMRLATGESGRGAMAEPSEIYGTVRLAIERQRR